MGVVNGMQIVFFQHFIKLCDICRKVVHIHRSVFHDGNGLFVARHISEQTQTGFAKRPDFAGIFTKQQGEALKYEPPPQTPKESTASGLIAEQHVHQKAEEEKRKADPNYTSPATDDPGEFIRVCLSNFTAAVTGHRELQSLDGTTFSDYQTNNVVFQLWDSTFHLYELNWANHTLPDFNDVVYRGRCELIQ